jgi:DNA polymerase-3 subunit alpha
MDFTHLHLHTEYSLRDAITGPEELMKKCSDSGMKSVAVTDHGNLMGMHKCAVYAKKYGVNLIPGNEMYVVPDVEKCRGREWGRGKSSHLVLIASDDKGWENLKLLTTLSNSVGFYCEPRVDYKMLKAHSEGLFALSACLGGVLAKPWHKGQSVKMMLDRFKEIFGDRFFLEIQLNGQDVQKEFNQELISLSSRGKTDLVATVDAHYLDKEDSHKQDLLFSLGMNKLLNDPDRHRYPSERHSVERPDEVHEKFTSEYGSIGKIAVQNTLQISENCRVNFETESKNYKIPSVNLKDQSDYEDFILWKKGITKAF